MGIFNGGDEGAAQAAERTQRERASEPRESGRASERASVFTVAACRREEGWRSERDLRPRAPEPLRRPPKKEAGRRRSRASSVWTRFRRSCGRRSSTSSTERPLSPGFELQVLSSEAEGAGGADEAERAGERKASSYFEDESSAHSVGTL